MACSQVNRLFHVFMRQADDYCNTSDMPDCNKAMMVHGLSSLARMQDQHLDTMDPYQRDAHELSKWAKSESGDKCRIQMRRFAGHLDQNTPRVPNQNTFNVVAQRCHQFARIF